MWLSCNFEYKAHLAEILRRTMELGKWFLALHKAFPKNPTSAPVIGPERTRMSYPGNSCYTNKKYYQNRFH